MNQIIENLKNKNQMPYDNGVKMSQTGAGKKGGMDIMSTDYVKGDDESGYKFSRVDKSDNYLDNTAMKNFQEFMKNRQDKAREAGEDAASLEKEEKENEKEVARNLSAEDIKRLKLMGVDVEGASMSDLLGMVNTMRHNEHRDETMAMMAEITMDEGDISGMTMIGGVAKVGGVEVDVDVADAYANEASFALDNKEILYLLHNDMPVNKDNLYKAHFSGNVVSGSGMSEEDFAGMKPQIKRLIEQAGLDVDEEHIEDAKLLIDNDIPLTTDNIRKYEQLKQAIGQDVDSVSDTASVYEADPYEAAVKLMSDVESISPELVYQMVEDDKEVTIASAINSIDNYDISRADEVSKYSNDTKSIVARRQMEEIRLSMTMEVAVRMTSLDVNVDTRELSKVINLLRDVERQLLRSAFKHAGVEMNDSNLLTYNELVGKVNDIAEAPAKILGAPLMNGGAFSVNALHISAVSESLSVTEEVASDGSVTTSVSYEKVALSYEAVGTAPRYDMGDSISKAFRNVDDILNEMSLPVNNETQRAVRILGYNQLEISEENITEVMNYDRQVNELINNLYPEAVLGMIKDNINPMDASIEDLNKTIRDKRYNEGVSDAEDFATYLRDMESKGEVSSEERESYIGIYRMMNKLAKSGDREAGWLFANGGRLTVRNLLSAMRSRRNQGLDVSIDDEFGMLSEITEKGSRIDTQIETAFNSEPDMAADNSAELMEDIERFNALPNNVEEFIRENDIEYSMVNAFAIDSMINSQGGIYQMVSEFMAGLKLNSGIKDDAIDDETEHITDSLTGEEIDLNPAQFETDAILESLKNSEEMSLKYDDLRDRITEMMYGLGTIGSLTSKDLSAVKTINAGFNIMSSMARNARYQIPVETEDGINVINLSIEHNQTRRGTISLSMAGTRHGNISADIRVGADRAMYGQLISDTSEGNIWLSLPDIMSSINEILGGQGFNTDGISFGTLSSTSTSYTYTEEMAVAGEDVLYQAAVTLVQSVVKISG